VNQKLETIRRARSNLDKLRTKLLRPTPQTLDAGLRDIQAAVNCMQVLELDLASGHCSAGLELGLGPQLRALKGDLQQSVALLEAAGKFYQGWARLISTGEEEPAGYDSRGKAGTPSSKAAGKMVIHG